MVVNTTLPLCLIWKRLLFFRALPLVVPALIAGILGADAYEAVIPKAASDADNACSSIIAYSLTHAEAAIQPYIRACSENPNKRVCDITVSMLKDLNRQERTYGLTCIGKP